jgi:L-2,4-diaminobutyrate decarboxylase
MDRKQRLKSAFDPSSFQQTGHKLVDYLSENLESHLAGKTEKAIPWEAPEVLWEKGLETSSLDPFPLFAQVAARSIHLHHPRYVGHQIAPPLPLVALSGLLSDVINNGMGIYEMGMAGTIMERYVVEWTASQFGLGAGSSGFLTSGGSLANLTALLAARQAQADHDIWSEGYGAGEKLAVMVSAEAHYCIQRAVRIMGWGEGGIISIPTDEAFRLDPAGLEPAFKKASQAGRRVIAVVACSCSTATGSYDPLAPIADFCEKHGLWFHVDAAHGGPAAFSEKHRSLLAGSERADSIVMDFHKMALCPALCTALLFRDSRQSYQTFAQKAAYLWEDPAEQEWHLLAKRTFECTKSMMSLKPYVLLRHFGPQVLADYVEEVFALAQTFGQMLREAPDFELFLWPEANIVCFRHLPEKGIDLNAWNAKVRRKLVEEGRFYLVQTEIAGRLYLRTSLMNPFTTEEDLMALLDRIRSESP